MKILNDEIEKKIQNDIIKVVLKKEYDSAIRNIAYIHDELYANIPDNKRISYGKVHKIKVLSEYLYTRLVEIDAPVYQIASIIFERTDDYKGKGGHWEYFPSTGLVITKKCFPILNPLPLPLPLICGS